MLVPGDKNYYAGISASRLGYTSKAKYTMASELDYNGQRLIAIVLNANGSFAGNSVTNYTNGSTWQTVADQTLYGSSKFQG